MKKKILIGLVLGLCFFYSYGQDESEVPKINLPDHELFQGELEDMNDDAVYVSLGELLSPTSPVVSTDGKFIYFTSKIKDINKQLYDYKTTVEEGVAKIFRAQLGQDGKIRYAELSNFNLDDKVSTHSSVVAVSHDNNVMYINTMDRGRDLVIYKVSHSKDKNGYAIYHPAKMKFGKYDNQSEYINEIMSSDEEYFIVTMWRKNKHFEKFERDLYVAKKIKEGIYSEFVRMGDIINTTGTELPCFLTADNKTLYFASDGLPGYGEKDIFMTQRLDDTWQHWSEPVNLGPRINSAGTENYFTMDPKGEYAYVIKWGADKEGFSDLFRIKMNSKEAGDH